LKRLETVKLSLKYSLRSISAGHVWSRGRDAGTIADPGQAYPTKIETRIEEGDEGMNGVAKRKRQEIEGSEAEITESDDIRCLGSHDKPATPLGELTTLVAALKEVIEQQNRTI
jgi:hypothetical protein